MAIKKYHLQTASDSGFTTDVQNFEILSGATLEHLETGLDPEETRFGRIRAEDTSGNFGEWSATVSETTDAVSTLLNNLVAYWKLDEASGTREDSVGANDLADNNTVTSATGKLSDAASFASANSEYLSIADNAALSMGDIDFTIAFWVNFTSLPAAEVDIVSKYETVGDQREYRVAWDAVSRLRFVVSPTGTGTTVPVTANNFGALSTGTWYFVVVWHDATANTINIQVNNGTANSTVHSTGVHQGTSPLHLGALGRAAPTFFLNGLADEVGIWKRVLTADEKTELYNSGSGITHPFS